MATDINMISSSSPAGGKKEGTVGSWQDAIRLGLKYRRMYGRSSEWRRFKNYYRGFFKDGQVPVNIIFAIGRSIIPQVYFRNPRIGVQAKKPGYGAHARVIERIDNWLLNETNLKYTMKSEILDTYLTGRGMGVLGYDSEYGFAPEQIDPNIYGDVSTTGFDAKSGNRIEYNRNVSAGMPWYLRVNPTDYVVPWGCRSIEEAQWFGFRKMRKLKDIKKDPKYSNTSDLTASFVSSLENSDKNEAFQRQEEDAEAEWVEIWEIHDQTTGKVKVLTLDHKKFLRDEQDHLQIEGLPTRTIGFNEDPDYFWWPSDCRMIEHQQLELNDIRTMAKHHRRVAVLKILYDKGMLKKEALEKLLDGDVKAAVEIDAGAGGDIRKAVALFQSHIPPDLISEARNVREDIREIIGFSRNQMGAFEASSGRRTAHEAEIVRAAAMIRIDERRDIIADHLSSVMRGYNQIIFENWNSERVIDIIGEDGIRYWVKYSGKEIKGEFNYKVNPEEAIPSDNRTKRAEAGQFLEMATKIPGIDSKYLLESYADTFDWLDAKMLFPGQGPGRSPERPVQFNDMRRQMPGALQQSSFPELGLGI